ncbi:MAG TPA: NAD(P)-binding domain-containing protein [Stellaceae bacterium]|nr:NAD(P)-binding domain-containing protein [Stellaceae bacterium]
MSATPELPIVDGATRLYGIIGDPIVQVGSPRLYTERFRAAGRNAILVPLHVLPDRFEETVRGLKALANLDGLVITVPYKARILTFVDRLLPMGEKVGAINAMRRESDGGWTGNMFDGRGLVKAVRTEGHAVEGRRVMLIGAGGVGSAIAVALAEAGAAAITISDLEPTRATALAERVARSVAGCRIVAGAPTAEGHDMIVNASPVGMRAGDGLPAPLGPLDPKTLAFDVVVSKEPTPFMRHARSFGCATLGGYAMMPAQVDEAIAFLGGRA